ncbi:MAG: pilus assembly protein PilP [Nitrospirae bacterium]|nr:pilus assembly protein PilP [Nitrospirota bacterium]
MIDKCDRPNDMDCRDMMRILCLLAVLCVCCLSGVYLPGECAASPPGQSPLAAAVPMDNETAAALTPLTIERYIYEPNGRRDPFLSLVERKKRLSASASVKPNRPPRAHSPLEEPELNAIVLKGIVVDAKKRYAVVEIDGKTYVINVGTYVGREGGRVVKINNDKLVVETITYDDLGKEDKSLHPIPLRKEGQE